MKIYISGKITGLDADVAFKNFEEAEQFLLKQNFVPVNPLKEIEATDDWELAMVQDIKLLFGCDGIFMLSNWMYSKGARIEKAIAEVLDKPVLHAPLSYERGYISI